MSRQTTHNLLARHLRAGRIVRVRRGVYATVPRGVDPQLASPDPYLIATKLAPDAAIAYHAALQFHGKSYSMWRRFHYVSRHRAQPFSFGGMEFRAVHAPAAIRDDPDRGGGIADLRHAGGTVRVTSLERTLVDTLDASNKSGGWEEVWRSLELVEFFDLDAVIAYALRLGSAVTVARVGYFLEQHRDSLMVEEHHFGALRARRPAQPQHMDPGKEGGELVSDWNLIVPRRVLTRSWQEVV